MNAHESKPEWFQMADADWAANPQAIDARGAKARRRNPIRLMAISTPLVILGAGLFVAQTQQAPEAFASSATTVATASQAPVASAPLDSTQNSVVVQSTPASITPTVVTTVPQTITPVTSSSSSALSTLNSGLVLPAKGSVQSGEDGDDGDDEGGQEQDD